MTSPCAVQRLTQVFLFVIRTNCSVCLSFHAEPVHDHRTARGTRSGRQCVSGVLCATSLANFFFSHRVDDQRGVSMYLVLIFRQALLCCTWACLCLERQHVECWLCVFGYPTGGGEKGSPPPKSNGYIFMYRGFIGGRGIAHPPSSSHPRCVLQRCRRVLRRRKDWHFSLAPHNSRSSPEEEGQALLLILPVCTSEGEGQAFSLTATVTTSEEEGQTLLTMSVSSSEVRSWHRWDAPAIP